MDPFHVPVLHTSFSGPQFAPEMVIMPDVSFDYTELGMQYTATRVMPDGRIVDRVSPVLFPNVRSVPDVHLAPGLTRRIRWCIPMDDAHHFHFNAMRVPRDFDGYDKQRGRTVGDKIWGNMTEQEHQDFPHDWEAQIGQGAITLHSEEHLAQSDKGVAMFRRLLRQQIRAVQEGKDPIGVRFDPASDLYVAGAGNFFRDSGKA
jgi:hypothetical protein